ncbi:uncharacterized protein [Misgurnus anguillicaudatus]|uniref:uncharacterized protein n=1 Tax=Misgurnus anguillicaudatus TaxID=75329 RepID=UPI002434F6E6|nr:uncharacterized protein si:dkey-283b1.6 [Misgurnus anguillicaudatus]
MNDSFSAFQIFIPTFICFTLIMCCAGFCKVFLRARKEHLQRLAAQVREQTPVYVIPISVSEDDLHRPPLYSTVQFYDPPPAYNEVKPEAFLQEPPPTYSETFSSSLPHS